MEEQIRIAARKYLHPGLRRPLGWLAGKFDEIVLQNLQGFYFDLKGGFFHSGGCKFAIPKDLTSMRYRSCFIRDKYEHEERELIQRFVKPEDRVLELGACLGIVSCWTNKLLADKSQHVVVEANPFCISAIHRNRNLNQAGFLVEHCAVANQPDIIFYLHPYVVSGTAQRPSNLPVRVPAKSLRQLEGERGPFTTLIIDIEGAEKEVFESSIEVLGRYRLVIAELHEWAIGDDGVRRCQQILRDCGLEFVGRVGRTEAWLRK